MKNLFNYIIESSKNDSLSDWYEDEYWEIKGESLPLHVTNNIHCGFLKLDNNKPISVIVQNERNKYILTFGNVSQISGTFKGLNKTIDSGVIIKTLENCVLSIRSGGEKGNRNSCEVVTREPIINVLKYFKRNNSEDHFSKVILSRFICDGYGVEEIANAAPSLLIEFSECVGLQKFNFDNDRKGLMFYTDKSTVNGKLKLNGQLNDKDPKIKVVIRKTDIAKMEKEAEKSRIAQINSWIDDFDVKKCEKDLKNAWEEDYNEIRVWKENQAAYVSSTALNYLKISWKLEDIKSYGTEGVVKKHVEYKLNDKNEYEETYSEGSSSFDSYIEYIKGWVDSNIHKYGAKPYVVIIEVGRGLVG